MSRGRVLITGATGMVGTLLSKRAVEEGYSVRAMVRSNSKIGRLEGLDVELFEADLSQAESLPPALKDMDMVVHSAAHVGDWGSAETFRSINVYALEHMLTAAQAAGGLRRWIQISSLGIYPARHHYGSDETVAADPEGLDGYTRTKAEAEVVLRRHIESYKFPGIILRPGFMYGVGDRHIVPRIVERLAEGKMKLIGDGQKLLNNTYVGNLIDAIMLALNKDEAIGETFNIRDERLVTREEFVGTIADYMGKPRPGKAPEWLARSAVGLIEGFAKARGAKQAPLLTRARMKFLTLNLDFSIDKAKRVLGYQARVDFQDGIRETLDWARSEHLIPGMSPQATSACESSS